MHRGGKLLPENVVHLKTLKQLATGTDEKRSVKICLNIFTLKFSHRCPLPNA